MRTIQFLIVLALCLGMLGSLPPLAIADSGFAGGSGTENDPFLVATAIQLNNVRNHLEKHFRQMADIDLGTAPWNQGLGWIPIGIVSHGLHYDVTETFRGVYDGNGHKIVNMKVDRSGSLEQAGFGLFGFIGPGGIVKQVQLENIQMRGRNWTGGIAGKNSGTIIGVSASGTIIDVDGFGAQYVGGLVGMNTGMINRSFSNVEVHSYENFGGVAGYNETGATIQDCYSTGDVKLKNPISFNGAGLVGYNSGLIQNCYTTGVFDDGSSDSFALTNNFGQMLSSYYEVNRYGFTNPRPPNGLTTTQMKQQASYAGWDFVNTWQIDENISYPFFRVISPEASSQITSAANTTFTIGQPGSFTVTATGNPLSQITLAGSLPAGVSFNPGMGSAEIKGTPIDNSGGVYRFTVTAANGVAPDATQDFTLTVRTVATIGTGGGLITSNGGDLAIVVPSDAVSEDVAFILTPRISLPHPTGELRFVGIGFDLTAGAISAFAQPLMVTVKYDPAALGGITAESLMLYKWHTGHQAWVDAACGAYDNSIANQFTVPVCSLSEFAVLGEGGYDVFLPLVMR